MISSGSLPLPPLHALEPGQPLTLTELSLLPGDRDPGQTACCRSS
jgi:hypothetical protein